VYLTVIFAYLATAYFVGSRLSIFQSLVVSGLFVFAALATIGACVAQLRRASEFQQQLSLQTDDLLLMPLKSASFWATYMPMLMLAGVVVGLFFMYDTMRKNQPASPVDIT
jgi:hypothetical protein